MAATNIRLIDNNPAFIRDLRAQVRSEFARRNLSPAGGMALWSKSLLIFGWFLLSYSGVLFSESVALLLLASTSCGFALAGLAFNVTHDGGHGAFSETARSNRVAAFVLDLLGMSSYLWRWKHNLLHHSYPNVGGLDDDIDAGTLARLHPQQASRHTHRWQHVYLWFLYPFLTVQWALVSDFVQLKRGRIGSFTVPPMDGRDQTLFWLAKLSFLAWALAIPWLAQGLGRACMFFLCFELVGGFVAAVAFQLAHCVEEADCQVTAEDLGGALDWTAHQLRSTVDFAPESRVLAWYLGGLNLQAVHHLFPGVAHVHYPWMARLLRRTAVRHGVDYRCNRSLTRQIRSHYRWLRRMGQGGTDQNVVLADAKRPEKSLSKSVASVS